ncbi:MAG: nitrate/nitrite transporter NrtS [Marinifilaceae bacterium]|jgi:hypothetical protein|nr:nitrate/nitrite transporter NrtS [Marinifilaceae bacterium]
MTLKLIFSKQVVRTAFKLSLIVGTILGLINHGPDIFAHTLSDSQIIQIMVTYLIPYSVSTYSSVCSIRNYEKRQI